MGKALYEYFQEEWHQLQQDAKEFAEQYPQEAQALYLDASYGRDPYVDHLLKGCAYLSAQLHKRLDDESYALPEQLLANICPALVEDIPAYAIAQYHRRGARSGVLPCADPLISAPLGEDKVICQFKTTHAIVVHGLSITQCSCPSDHELVLIVEAAPYMEGESLTELPIYLNMPYDKASFCFYMMNQKLKAAYYGCGESRIPLLCEAASSIYQYTLSETADSGLLAYQYLLDYFCFMPKYLMIALVPEGQEWTIRAGKMEIRLEFDASWPSRYIPKHQDLALNCVPIVNRYEKNCEPIIYDHKQYHYTLTPDRQSLHAVRLLSVLTVTGRVQKTGELIHYRALRLMQGESEPYYVLSRKETEAEYATYYLSCQSSQFQEQIVSVSAYVCNGHRPHDDIRIGDLSTKRGSEMSASTLMRPTPCVKRPDQRYSQTLLNYVTLTLQSLTSVSVLKETLKCFNWTRDPAHSKRIEGIKAITMDARLKLSKGLVRHEQEMTMILDKSYYSSVSDLYLFATVLHIFFSFHAPLDEELSLVIKLYPSQEVIRWKPLRKANTLRSSSA